jgi:mono/diheme cytochrome c family protein
VRAFLADPATAKPGTTMPNVFAALPEAERRDAVEALTHFVMQSRERPPGASAAPGSPEDGKELFHSIGCVACHGQVPLTRLGEKYAPGELARFLEKPLETRPAARMPDLHLAREEAAHLAAYLAPGPPAAEPAFTAEPAFVKRGGELYQSLGCAACHGGGEAKAKPLRELKSGGCLSPEAKPHVPQYGLSSEQRTAITAVLARPAMAAGGAEEIRHLMLQRNCFACHSRGGGGGPAPELAVHFTSTRDDLGDQGRFPPPLDGVGRKLQPWALESIIQGKNPVRSYMRVRMPDFGEEAAARLTALFAAADADPNEKPTAAKDNPNQVGRNDPGRELVGTKGYACIACHELHGHPSLGIGAYDLAEMPRRLRPEWMRDFLINPAAFPTGARMPSFWPNGKPLNPKIGGSNTERQIDHIRVYLTEVDQSLPPEGFIDHAAFELKPADQPIVFRTFVAGVSTHAIAVGFPGGVNAVFDALGSRWALAWRGRFLDADGTWNQRVAKMEKPLGEEIVNIEQAGTLSLAGAAPKYRGYRLGRDGVPIFLYELGPLQIEDRVEPTANRCLRRTLRVTGKTDQPVQFEAAPPKGVTARLASGAPLPAKLDLKQGVAELVEEITW